MEMMCLTIIKDQKEVYVQAKQEQVVGHSVKGFGVYWSKMALECTFIYGGCGSNHL
jgi:hypothetical protein